MGRPYADPFSLRGKTGERKQLPVFFSGRKLADYPERGQRLLDAKIIRDIIQQSTGLLGFYDRKERGNHVRKTVLCDYGRND